MQLTSPKNPFLQQIRRAAAAGRPTDDGLIVAEGPHLLDEALHGLWNVERVFVTETARTRYGHLIKELDFELVELSKRAMSSIVDTRTTQGVLALLRPRAWSWQDLRDQRLLWVVLDRVQDPGNAGTIFRAAEAFGATGALLLEGCVGIANGKFLRATAGSIFRLPFLAGIRIEEYLEQVRAFGVRSYALMPQGKATLSDIDFQGHCALALGSEGAGVSRALRSESESVFIPTRKVESLNVGMAASIALFEAAKQRGLV